MMSEKMNNKSIMSKLKCQNSLLCVTPMGLTWFVNNSGYKCLTALRSHRRINNLGLLS